MAKYGIRRYADLVSHLGMRPTKLTRASPVNLQTLVKEMGGLENVIYENYLTPLAIRVLAGSKNAHDLMIKIGWDIPTTSTFRFSSGKLNERGVELLEYRILKLFGMIYEEAKNKYFNGYLGDN